MIRFENVSLRFPSRKERALSDVSFDIQRGEFVFLVGPSGSGKSSCLRLIMREHVPSQGRVVALGHDTATLSHRKTPFYRRQIGFVFQDFQLLESKTVAQNVGFALQVIGRSRGYTKQAVTEALERVGLAGMGKRMPNQLSGGEQQRVAIARALVNDPQLLLADEPTGNLDPATSVEIMRILARINAAGTTVVMATHEATFVDQMQRRVIEMSEGQLMRDEHRGGYGDTSVLQTIGPKSERGIAARAALDAVREAQLTGIVETRREADLPVRPITQEPSTSFTGETPDEATAEAPAEAEPQTADHEHLTADVPREVLDGSMAEKFGLDQKRNDVGPTS